MAYKARRAYRSKEVVSKYEEERFKGLKGYLVNKRELKLIDKALKHADITPPATILDIPCGTGRLSIHLAGMGFKLTGVDISSEMLSFAKEKIRRFNLGNKIKVEVGDAESLHYLADSFDICVSLRFFGHTPEENRKKILKELSRVTKKHFILAYYLKNSLQYYLRRKKREKKSIEWHPFTLIQIEDELDKAGLRKLKSFFLAPGISETVVVLCEKRK